MSISKLAKDLKGYEKFPPVDKWNPDLCEGQEFFIDREGNWFYNHSPIKNQKLTNLFSTVLKNEDNNVKCDSGRIELKKSQFWQDSISNLPRDVVSSSP